MKHLKPYKIFESQLSETDSLNDIAEDMRDGGYIVKIEEHQSKRKYEYKRKYIKGDYIKVDVFKETPDGVYAYIPISFSEIRSSLEHMIKFMKTEGYEYDISYSKKGDKGKSWLSYNVSPEMEEFLRDEYIVRDSYKVFFYKLYKSEDSN